MRSRVRRTSCEWAPGRFAPESRVELLEQVAMNETSPTKHSPRCGPLAFDPAGAQSSPPRWGCTLVGIDRSAIRYRSVNDDRARLVHARIAALSLRFPLARHRGEQGPASSSRAAPADSPTASESRLQPSRDGSADHSAASRAVRGDRSSATDQPWAHGFVIDCRTEGSGRRSPEDGEA